MTNPQRSSSYSEVALRETALIALRLLCIIAAGIIGLAILNVLGVLSPVLVFLSVGCIGAFVASPVANVLERRGCPRGLGSLFAVTLVIAAVILIFVVVIPLVAAQLMGLVGDISRRLSSVGSWITQLEHQYSIISHFTATIQVDQLVADAQRLVSSLAGALFDTVRNGILPLVNNVASTTFTVCLGFVLAYWLVCDYPRINEEICQVLGDERATGYRLVLAVVAQSVGGYLRSTVINSCIQGILAGLGFFLVGHPYAAVMGLLSGILNFIPVVGPSISAMIATVIALFYSPVMAAWTLAVAVISQNVTDNVLAPKINQSTMQIHPVLSLTALVVGSTLLGTIGMVIAIPLCAVIKSLFIFYFETKTQRQIVSYNGALFKGTPFYDASGSPVAAYDALGDDQFVLSSEIISDDAIPAAQAAPRPHASLKNQGLRKIFKDISAKIFPPPKD